MGKKKSEGSMIVEEEEKSMNREVGKGRFYRKGRGLVVENHVMNR